VRSIDVPILGIVSSVPTYFMIGGVIFFVLKRVVQQAAYLLGAPT